MREWCARSQISVRRRLAHPLGHLRLEKSPVRKEHGGAVEIPLLKAEPREILLPHLDGEREELSHHQPLHHEDHGDRRDVAPEQTRDEQAHHAHGGHRAGAERPPLGLGVHLEANTLGQGRGPTPGRPGVTSEFRRSAPPRLPPSGSPSTFDLVATRRRMVCRRTPKTRPRSRRAIPLGARRSVLARPRDGVDLERNEGDAE